LITSASFIVGSVSVVKLQRAGISLAIICQVAMWSIIHMQFSNDDGLNWFAGVVDIVSVLTCSALYRLSDSIQEYRIGSEYVPPTRADVNRMRWASLSCGLVTLGVGIVLIIVTSQRDLEHAMRSAKIAVWVGHTLGGLMILMASLGLVGALALDTLQSRWMLIAAFGISLCIVSFACIYIVWYAYADEGLALFCGLNAQIQASVGWDDNKCKQQKSVHETTTAFIFLTIISSGAMGWCTLQLSERCQSYGIVGGEGFYWTVGHSVRVLGQMISGIRTVRLLNNLELLAILAFGSLLLAFGLDLRVDNNAMNGRLNSQLRAAWYVVFGVIAVVVARFVKAEFNFIESRRILVFSLILQLWVAGNAVHAFFVAELVYQDGFPIEPYLQKFVPYAVIYGGTRRDVVHKTGIMHGLLWVTEVVGVVTNLLELESDYSMHGFLWAKSDTTEAVHV